MTEYEAHNIDEMIAVLQAAKAGKPIQYRLRYEDAPWIDKCPPFGFADFDYRIKPEEPRPREWYVPEYWLHRPFDYKNLPTKFVKVREVS